MISSDVSGRQAPDPARPLILVAHPHLIDLVAPLADDFEIVANWDNLTESQARSARVLVVSGGAPLDPALLARLPSLALIACFTAGYDMIDLAWVEARAIAVTHAPGVSHDDVADHAVGMIIASLRRIVDGDRQVRAGDWPADRKTATRSLTGLTVGIVGLGRIGNAVAERVAAMRMRVAWWGPQEKPASGLPRAATLLDLARDSDVLVVTARPTAHNRGLISRDILQALGRDGLLVNVARGQLVDEDALLELLASGGLGGAALDVFATEPTPPERWRDLPNLVLTPHTAGVTDQAIAGMRALLRANLTAFFRGTPLVTPISADR